MPAAFACCSRVRRVRARRCRPKWSPTGSGLDLLLVDISRVVSKWIGETEQEPGSGVRYRGATRAVLFFDEADACSDAGQRSPTRMTGTPISRRLTCCRGSSATRGWRSSRRTCDPNIDPAFIRRLEFVVDFQEPDREERARLWRCHIPVRADARHRCQPAGACRNVPDGRRSDSQCRNRGGISRGAGRAQQSIVRISCTRFAGNTRRPDARFPAQAERHR